MEVFGNNAATNLNGSLSNVATTVTVLSTAAPFPQTGNFRVRIESEIVLVTAVLNGTQWTITRGQEGTSAVSHTSGVEAAHIITAGSLNQLKADAVAGVTGTGAISVNSGVVSVAAASGSVPGTMSSADYTKLSGVATGAEVNYINSLGSLTGGITASVTGRALAIGINLATAVSQGAMPSTDKAAMDAKSATATNDSIVVRTGAGNIVGNSFVANTNDNLASQPPHIVGRASDGTYKTYQTGSITVGSATNATNATSAGSANALASGTTDGDKLHGINVSAASGGSGIFTGGWYTLNGQREWFLYSGTGTIPSGTPRVILGPWALPNGITSSAGILEFTASALGGSSAAMQYITTGIRFASSTTFEVIIGCPNGDNLETRFGTAGFIVVTLVTV